MTSWAGLVLVGGLRSFLSRGHLLPFAHSAGYRFVNKKHNGKAELNQQFCLFGTVPLILFSHVAYKLLPHYDLYLSSLFSELVIYVCVSANIPFISFFSFYLGLFRFFLLQSVILMLDCCKFLSTG